MNPEKQRLMEDLLSDQDRREATLLAAGKILRRRRRWRVVRHTSIYITVACTALWLFKNQALRPLQGPTPGPAIASTQSSTRFHVQRLTDDELLALFPNTPVGLATLPNGKKVLVFPRREDEARYFGHF